MHPDNASIKSPRTRRDRQERPARSQSWRVHQDFGDPLPTGDRMNACSSRSIPAAAIRYGRGAVHETDVIDNPSIVTTTARIDTSCETNKIPRSLQLRKERPAPTETFRSHWRE